MALVLWTRTLDDWPNLTYFFAYFLGGAMVLGLGAIATACAAVVLAFRAWKRCVPDLRSRGELLHAVLVAAVAAAAAAFGLVFGVSA